MGLQAARHSAIGDWKEFHAISARISFVEALPQAEKSSIREMNSTVMPGSAAELR